MLSVVCVKINWKGRRIMEGGISAQLKHDQQDKGRLTAQAGEFLMELGLFPMAALWKDVWDPYHSLTDSQLVSSHY